MKTFPFNRLRRYKTPSEDGFTLVELMIVVVIIGILAAIAVPIYANQMAEAHKAQVRSDVASTVTNLKNWENNNGYLSVPPAATFNGLIVKTNSSTQITLQVFNPDDQNNIEFCVQGQEQIGSNNFVYSYSTKTKQGTEAVCTAAPVDAAPNYG